MFTPKCGFCGGTSFRLATPISDVQGAKFKMPFVICTGCSAAIAVLSQFDPGVTAKAAEDKIDKLDKRLSNLEGSVHSLSANLQRLSAIIERLK